MRLTRLQVRHVRLLKEVGLEPDRGLNIIEGANASGKTSLLEAIHILGVGRSFRTRNTREMITRGERDLTVFGAGIEGESPHRLGVRKGIRDKSEIQIDGQRAKAVSELAERLPLLVITPESHDLVSGGPSERRALLDWGVFHVEPRFHQEWLTYYRALKQRNRVLKEKASDREIGAFEKMMSSAGEQIALGRQAYLELLLPNLAGHLAALLPGQQFELSLKRGWPDQDTLARAIETGRERDWRVGHSTVGPHRAELVIVTSGRPAAEVVSRGQQKLLVVALRLAQLEVFREKTGRQAVLLIDDLPSELDRGRRKILLEQLNRLGAQVFVTATEAGLIDAGGWPSRKVFHVEQGQLTEVV